MNKIKTTEGDIIVRDGRYSIVASRFNNFIVDSLIEASLHCLQKHGASDGDIEIVRVPGAFEIPTALDKIAATRRFDGIIALGAIIRGDTPHFDYVAGECMKGISAVSHKYGIPIGNGILAVNNLDQATERAGSKAGNKGEEATLAAIEMVNLLRLID
tara:strand:- start:3002 stop:3475 length:474 start_codon:yes stop_codon:yes gene_type:complete